MSRTSSLINEELIASHVHLEAAVVLAGLAGAAWFIYKVFLRTLSPERHRNLTNSFRNLIKHLGIGGVLYLSYHLLIWVGPDEWPGLLVAPYLGLLAILSACVIFIKTMRILAFEYLFYGSMKVGVPLLLVNMLSLILSLIALGWVLTSIFSVQVTHVLATSAVFSIVLGLALQDTLGNLFAGIALQLDKPYEIGEWVEIRNGTDKVVGQIEEISWRATTLFSITDELITIPNRTMAQAQVSNFAGATKPFLRSQLFRLPYDTSIEQAKAVLLKSAAETAGILTDPKPLVFISETTESWISMKLIYALVDYGGQFRIADSLLTVALKNLEIAHIRTAAPRLAIEHSKPTGV